MRSFPFLVLFVFAVSACSTSSEARVEILVDTDRTILGQSFAYPEGNGRIVAQMVTVPPGGVVALHEHHVPVLGYILDGEIVVEYEDGETHVYHAGDALVEAIERPHSAYNPGWRAVRILAVFVGAEGVTNTTRLAPRE